MSFNNRNNKVYISEVPPLVLRNPGKDGTSGTSGVDGTFFGSSGTSGLDGTLLGSSGTSGTSGLSGVGGSSGTSGVSGSSGVSGTSGVSGSSGTSGESGTTGIDGTNGTDGVDGTSGTSGFSIDSGSFATTGSNIFIGNETISGSILISGSIIPNTGIGTFTSSFSLGSATNAWKDLYISHGSIIFVDAVTQETSSFSIENNAGGQNTVKYTAAITASAYLGDGRQLTNLSANTNWNNTYDSYLIRKTEQLTFSGDYILENAFLLIEGGDEEVEYSANKSFKKEGTLFIGGNLLLKDSVIENNGKISVGGEVILIGNSSIDGTGIII